MITRGKTYDTGNYYPRSGPCGGRAVHAGKLPALQEALTVSAEGTERTMEVAQHVNETTVRCIMLSASEGLGKGMTVTATGHGLTATGGRSHAGPHVRPAGQTHRRQGLCG